MTEIISFAAVFVISLLFGFYLIPKLRKLKIAGHAIRAEGPAGHQSKKGTPLMGGLIFILPMLVASIVFTILRQDYRYIFVSVFVSLFGLIGFLDDYVKIYKKGRNGIKAKQKIILLTSVSTVFAAAAYLLGLLDGQLVIPLLGFGYYFDIGLFIIPLAVLVLVSVTNAVNLTDGLDGLAGSVTGITLLTFIILTSLKAEWGYLNIIAIAVFAGLAAFLYFNYHPASVFMGDSGSLALGGLVGILALLTKTTLILPVIGFIYLIETISVILQVFYFKKTHKRLFRMSPLHHHFELGGMSENLIVLIFSATAALFCTFGIYLSGIRPF